MAIAKNPPSTKTNLEIEIAPYGLKNGETAGPNPTQERVLDWVDNIREETSVHVKKIQSTKMPAPFNDGKGIPVLYLQGGAGSGKTRAFMAPVLEMLLRFQDSAYYGAVKITTIFVFPHLRHLKK